MVLRSSRCRSSTHCPPPPGSGWRRASWCPVSCSPRFRRSRHWALARAPWSSCWRRVRQERLERETRAAADRAARARLSATREISHAVSADFAKALASASAVAEALGRGDPEAHALLTQTRSAINDALHTVRETIWALDPDAAEWEVIEPHLRRMVADLGPDGSRLTFAVEPGCLVTSEERVRLARRLRGVLRDSPGPVHARIEQGEGGFRLRLKTPRDAVAPWLNTNGGSPVGAKALEK